MGYKIGLDDVIDHFTLDADELTQLHQQDRRDPAQVRGDAEVPAVAGAVSRPWARGA